MSDDEDAGLRYTRYTRWFVEGIAFVYLIGFWNGSRMDFGLLSFLSDSMLSVAFGSGLQSESSILRAAVFIPRAVIGLLFAVPFIAGQASGFKLSSDFDRPRQRYIPTLSDVMNVESVDFYSLTTK